MHGFAALLLLTASARAAVNADWATPIEPFHIVGNLSLVFAAPPAPGHCTAAAEVARPRRNALIGDQLGSSLVDSRPSAARSREA
jgi:hypothetical protein